MSVHVCVVKSICSIFRSVQIVFVVHLIVATSRPSVGPKPNQTSAWEVLIMYTDVVRANNGVKNRSMLQEIGTHLSGMA